MTRKFHSKIVRNKKPELITKYYDNKMKYDS